MRCRYCGVKNPATVRVCVSCNKPLPAHGPIKWPEKPRTPHLLTVRPSVESSALGSVSTHFGEAQRISRLMHSVSIPSAKSSPARPLQMPHGIGSHRTETPSKIQQQAKPQAAQSIGAQQQRIEPHLDASPRQALRKPNYEELRAIAALYDPPPARQRRPWMRAGIISMIFVVGTSIGFGVASLLTERTGTIAGGSERVRVYTGQGTSPGELPYDGNRIAESPSDNRSAQTDINAKELPYGDENAFGESAAQLKLAPAETSTPEVSVAPPAKRELAPARPAAGKRSEQAATSAAKKASQPPLRRRSIRRTDKDREIERIRQQAVEELKKKTESRQRNSESRDSNSGAKKLLKQQESRLISRKALAMSGRLAQCEQADNIILRERCKWQLCDGKWGKNGCPSYLSRVSVN